MRVKELGAAVGVVVLLALLAAPAATSAQTTITIGDNFYEPDTATHDLGQGEFRWQWGPGGVGTADLHNVVDDDGLFDSGEPVSSRPGGFSVTASAGSYAYFCSLHVMFGDVNVRPVLGPTDPGQGPIHLSWATPETTTGDSYDVRYRAGRKWKKWKKDTGKLSGVFGKNRKPTKVKVASKYRFQVRSRAGKRRSDWSPELVIQR